MIITRNFRGTRIMNKVSKKERNHSGKKCSNVSKKGAQEVVKNSTATTNTTEDLCEHLDKLTVQSKPVNGIVNGNIKHEEASTEKVTEPDYTTGDTKGTINTPRPSKGKSKNRRNGAKRNTIQANQATSSTITATPTFVVDTTSSVPCASTSLDSSSVSPRESLQEDCPCILSNETSSIFFNDTDISDDFDISAFIKARCEQARAQLNSKTIESNIKEKASTSQEKAKEVVSLDGDMPVNEDLEIVKNPVIEYVGYESELQMPLIMKIIQKDLSEPYSIYTYRYFIHNWPNLCFLAMCDDLCVGAIVCKLDQHRLVIKRGYIAMLAVDGRYRKHGIGSTLVRRAIAGMVEGDADEVVLETEITNRPALRLYEALGFVRDKRLFRYYLNGVDALRLKLWLR